MNVIPGITRSGYPVPPVKHTVSTENISKSDTDSFISDFPQEEIPCGDQHGRISREQIEDLSQKYDLHNMDRNQFSRLLAELRDSGVITAQEYSAAYAGTMPQGMSQKPVFPFGKEKADFIQLMSQCVKCCADMSASADGEVFTAIYTRLHTVFNQIDQTESTEPAVEQSDSAPAAEEESLQGKYNDKVIQLYEQLKAEKKPGYLSSPSSVTARKLAKEYLLSDDKLVESLAKKLWIDRARQNQAIIKSGHTERIQYLPPDYTEIADRIRGVLAGKYADDISLYADHGNHPMYRSNIYVEVDEFLRAKARSGERLNEIERQLSKVAAQWEKNTWQNFDDQMKGIQDEINNQLGESEFSVDMDKEYRFYLDTATFTFSVKGGSDAENKAIENAINTHPRENYKFDPLHETLMAIYFSRPEDLSVAPWRTELVSEKLLQKYGVSTDISASYSKKMEQFLAAYSWHEMDQNLKFSFGFGVDDIDWDGENLVGKTDEVTKLIEKMDENMRRATGSSYAKLRNEYTGTPEFSEPVFVFKNGKFQLTYEKHVF